MTFYELIQRGLKGVRAEGGWPVPRGLDVPLSALRNEGELKVQWPPHLFRTLYGRWRTSVNGSCF